MDIKSTLVGAGAVVLLAGGIFGAAAVANAGDVPSGSGVGRSVIEQESVAVEKIEPPAVVVPEPVVTPEPEPVVVAEPAPEVVVPEPVVEPAPVAPEPEVAVEYAGPPIPAGGGIGVVVP